MWRHWNDGQEVESSPYEFISLDFRYFQISELF